MKTLRSLILRWLALISAVIFFVVLMLTLSVQLFAEQQAACNQAAIRSAQIQQLLTQNEAELSEQLESFYDSNLHKAETVAYILSNHPELISDVAGLRNLAHTVQVDEIHLFNPSGRIYAGTNPEYYGYTMDSGEQISFFKPMLTDKTLRLAQELTPNTAANQSVQYSALWNSSGTYIVQVGMKAHHITALAEKNDLSSIFSLLGGTTGVSLYAVDSDNKIVGASIPAHLGKTIQDIGFRPEHIKTDGSGFHAVVDGVQSFCVFTEYDGLLMARIISTDTLYSDLQSKLLELSLILMLIFVGTVFALSTFLNRYIIKTVHRINDKLQLIADGNLDVRMNVDTCREFAALSTHINHMILRLLANTDRLSYILNHTNLRIGIYEYSEKMQGVRFTDFVPQLLNLSPEETQQFRADRTKFRSYMDALRQNKLSEDSDILALPGDRYIVLDEHTSPEENFGIIKDITDEILNRRRIETERDTDLLTGLYNRRAFESQAAAICAVSSRLGHGALVVIDADGLKEVNDRYGHDKGDKYLKAIANLFQSLPREHYIAARQGGDEFVLLLYGFGSEHALLDVINTLKYLQSHSTADLEPGVTVPLDFSFGYSLLCEGSSFTDALSEADARMYTQKKARKASAPTKKSSDI
ncbi:MAG: GGDEF domain-containing protein [Clostridia bacterium]|nr:GGDEF domain-containing protein [Clostridia bacterium]